MHLSYRKRGTKEIELSLSSPLRAQVSTMYNAGRLDIAGVRGEGPTLLVLFVVVDLVVPEESLDRLVSGIACECDGRQTLSPSPHQKFLVRMF